MPRIERTVIAGEHPSTTRIRLMEGETELSHVSVLHLPMYVGGAVVTCGGIGGVGTDREHRNRGYARTVLADALEYMTDQGMHLSALFGIPDFYHRFGYAAGLACATVLTTFAVASTIGTRILSTLTAMFNPLPAIALLPLALIWRTRCRAGR